MPESNDKTKYPQIPTTVWWGVRDVLNRKPRATLDDSFLSIELNVQPAAARQYIGELIAVGILDENFKATELANRWRLDDSYADAVEEIIQRSYPDALRDLVPHESGERQKAISFFQSQGLGQGAAGNKASTYFLIGAPTPNETPSRAARSTSNSDTAQRKRVSKKEERPRASDKNDQSQGARVRNGSGDSIPLNINLQIHISADASGEQIEGVFSAMQRYLYAQRSA